MKRFSVLLLILCAFLSSCTNNLPGDDVIVPQDTEPTDGVPTFFVDGELPEIGEFSGKKHSNRFYEDYTPHFIPSDEYNTLLPFVGSIKEYKTEWGDKHHYAAYGLCTADGRIVMDAQQSVEGIYHRTSNDGFGYYELTFMDKEDYESEGYDMYPVGKSLLIPDSGKWSIELPPASYVSNVDYGIITVMCPVSYDNANGYPMEYKAIIYDYEGKLINEFENVDHSGPSFGGLIKLSKYSDGSNREWFVNRDGDTVFGPYTSASDFNEYGICSVTDLNGEAYLMDSTEKRLTDTEYSSIYTVYGNEQTGFSATHKNDPYKRDVFANDGEYLCTVTTTNHPNITILPDKTVIYSYRPSYGSAQEMYRYGDGTEFVSKELGVMPNQYSSAEGVFWHRDNETADSVLFDSKGETIIKLNDVNNIFSVSNDGRILAYSTGKIDYIYDKETQKHTVESTLKLNLCDLESGETFFIALDGGYGNFCGQDDRYFLYSISDTDEPMGDFSYGIYDIKERKLLFNNCPSIKHYEVEGKHYFNVCTDNYIFLYDGDFNTILKIINE